LVFYAGHGLQIKGENYFPAVDADITSEEDVPTQSLAVTQIMDVLGDAKTRLNLVFLDACRNNPYSRSFRSASNGLSRVNAPSGTLISFATRPGGVAADGIGRNGLYTSALLEQINKTNQPIEQVIKKVVSRVKSTSKGHQEPWMEGSIEGEFCFGECNVQSTQSVLSDDRLFWESVKDSKDVTEINSYLEQFPHGIFVGLAKARVAALIKTEPQGSSGKSPQVTAPINQLAATPAASQGIKPNHASLLGQAQSGSVSKVRISTTMGDIEAELYADKAPKTVANFLQYVNDKHYDGTIFHRVIAGFMVQGGGFDAQYKEKKTRAPVQHEGRQSLAAGLKNTTGTLAMARTNDPQSATAQFFINVVDNSFLDPTPIPDGDPVAKFQYQGRVYENVARAQLLNAPQLFGYTVFGKVTSGMDVVQKIRNTPTGAGGPFPTDVPRTPVVIQSITLLK
jgi:peptidyl-prolyl cis-trans isomerase A (cyclophilin A)